MDDFYFDIMEKVNQALEEHGLVFEYIESEQDGSPEVYELKEI